MTDEKIIDKLKKLKAMADGAGKVGNEAEAQAFAAMVQTLLAKHKLDASDIEWEQQQLEELVKIVADPTDHRTKIQEWEVFLAQAVAKASSCRPLVSTTSPKSKTIFRIWFYGTRTDATAAQEAYLYLLKAAKHLAEREYVTYFYKCKDEGDVTRARGYKGSWLLGFVSRLTTRYKENQQVIISAAAGTALIRLSQSLVRVDEAIKDNFKGKVVVTDVPDIKNLNGFKHGQAAANRVTLANDPRAAERQVGRG